MIAHKQHASTLTKAQLYAHLSTKVAKWWLPDDILFVTEIPKTSVGKFDKKRMRTIYEEHYMKQAPNAKL